MSTKSMEAARTLDPRADSQLLVSVAAILFLNLLDGIFTLLVVTSGIAIEANPIMAGLLENSPLQFMLGKLTLVSVGILVLWRMRARRLAIVGILGSLFVYSSILIYHLQSLHLLDSFIS